MAIETLSMAWTTGRTVSVSLRRVSDGQYLDFFDGAFKASGWTTRKKGLSEDPTDLGFYVGTQDMGTAVFTDFAAYHLLGWDSTITTRPIGSLGFSVVGGSIVLDGSAGKAVWREDLSLHDQQLRAGPRAATFVMNLLRRFALFSGARVTQSATQQVVTQNDGATALNTAPVSDDGLTQTLGPGA